jgi:hypothetical protein
VAGEEFTFGIGIPVDTNAGDAASEVESLRDRIAASKLSVAALSGTLKQLKSSSLEATTAKESLKKSLQAESQAIEEASLKLVKMGTTYDAQAVKAKQVAKAEADRAKTLAKAIADEKAKKEKTAKETEKAEGGRAKSLSTALSAAGGPVAGLAGKLSSLKDTLTDTGGGMNLAILGAAGLVAAVAALVVGLVAGAAALTRWIFKGADAARSMGLMREAAAGSKENAKALGQQIDLLGHKVPTSTEALNELGASMARSGIGGQTLVDTLNAVSQASSANGDAAGAKLREIVERGKLTQRMYLGLQELQGTGLDFTDVAEALAKATGKGVKEARAALLEGRVTLASGAEALRKATEAKFGGLNLEKMLSFDGLAETMRKRLGALTADVKLEPFLRGLAKILAMFDETSSTGAVLKRTVTAIGDGLALAFEKGGPLAQSFIRGLIIGGLKAYIAYLQLKNGIEGAFKSLKRAGIDVDAMTGKLDGLSLAADAGSLAFGVLPMIFGVLTASIGAFTDGLNAVEDAYDLIANIEWTALGSSIVDGLVEGVTGGANRLKDAVTGLAGKVKTGFKDALGIHSPSRVFAEYGANTAEGFEQGVSSGAGDASDALERMAAPPAKSAAAGGGASGASPTTVNVTINAQGATKEAVDAMSSPEFLAQLTKAVLDGCAGGGVMVPG